jgi:hypothetical protein
MNSNFKPRSVATIALIIYENLPPEQKDFRQDIMNFVQNDLCYLSPEMFVDPIVWNNFEKYVMRKHINVPKQSWEKRIIDIYTGKIKVPLKINFNNSD